MALPALLQPEDRADIGVFGGSGFYSLLDGAVEQVSVSRPVWRAERLDRVGRIGDVRVAFLPRHGQHHRIPPHAINYRANLWAMAQLGVTRIIAPTAAGSLQPNVKPGDFVVCDQFVDRTYGRAQTFYDGPRVVHISTADPYCPELRAAQHRRRPRAGHHRPRAGHGRGDPGPALFDARREQVVRRRRAGK